MNSFTGAMSSFGTLVGRLPLDKFLDDLLRWATDDGTGAARLLWTADDGPGR